MKQSNPVNPISQSNPFNRGTEWERERNDFLIGGMNKIIFFFFAFMNSAHLKIDVHYSNGAKIFRLSSTAAARFLSL